MAKTSRPPTSSDANKQRKPSKKGGILAALRRSPMVGANMKITRPRVRGRKVDLTT